ncbi:MAG: FKBP-type peptidyl-prolyl cis-trans isomerase [Bacteroidales bacterium]|nr:FKBP-type peptidyl-prolyl cis-trans isomerase [Bacteroidales bacterium]MCM1415801.1 FKBP-type peptidyl-prolyl cis-trans isomerase [bacterium]MCM1422705.1 FKBP-type peptidyl-prolyl cis-trans isomerase [bacterium]
MEKKKSGKADAGANVSKSKAKREERRKEVKKAKRNAYAARTTGFVLAAVIALLIVGAVGKKLYILAIRTTPNEDYSAGLTDEGRIEDADMASMLTLADYRNISLPTDEIAASEEEVAAEIDSALESYQELSTDEQREIADGDTVNIDFVGTVDGEEFDGGSSQGAGYDLTIGSGSFVDDFEEQLIGHKPGEDVTVEVTFPENYSEELAGKDASFAVTVNGIMVTPELTDDFVAENLADTEEVSTAAEYRAKVEDEIYRENLEEYLKEYVLENSTVNSYPKKYVKAQKSLLKYEDGETEPEDEISYEKELTERAQETVKEAMVWQAVFEDAGLIYDADAHYAETVEEMGEEYAEEYGAGYLAQEEIRQMAIDYLVGLY